MLKYKLLFLTILAAHFFRPITCSGEAVKTLIGERIDQLLNANHVLMQKFIQLEREHTELKEKLQHVEKPNVQVQFEEELARAKTPAEIRKTSLVLSTTSHGNT